MRARQCAARRSPCSRSRPRRRSCCSRAIPADVLLLEVGLGGRLDATNVIERPLASVDHAGLDRSCRVSRRHAREDRRREGRHPQARRAGGVAPQTDARRWRCIERQAAARARAAARRRRALDGDEERGRLVYQDDDGPARSAGAEAVWPPSVRQCRHSRSRRCARAGLKLPLEAFEAGVAQGRLAGAHAAADARAGSRRSAPPGSELWLDGGHNADGGRAIAAALGDLEERVSRPLVLIVGMLSTKDSAGFLRNFAGLARRVIAVPIQTRTRACRPRRSRTPRAPSAFRPRAATSIEAALAAVARLDLDPPPRILITGSLYLAGEVLARTARRRM